ncbi:UNVERIFIED_ORG: hypothetical protein J2W38_001607 [Variovorax paradoxus]|nr:hypothetical protein [Variovorax paradoxus]
MISMALRSGYSRHCGPPLLRLRWIGMVSFLQIAVAASTSRSGLNAATAIRLPTPLMLLSRIPLCLPLLGCCLGSQATVLEFSTTPTTYSYILPLSLAFWLLR